MGRHCRSEYERKVVVETTPKDMVNIIKMAKLEVFDDIGKQPLYAVDKGGGKIKYIDVKEADWFKTLKKKHLRTPNPTKTEKE